MRPATLLKKDSGKGVCFPVNFEKFLRTPFLTGHLRWLFLKEKGKRSRNTSYVTEELYTSYGPSLESQTRLPS